MKMARIPGTAPRTADHAACNEPNVGSARDWSRAGGARSQSARAPPITRTVAAAMRKARCMPTCARKPFDARAS
jgi:hypothetical protein